MKIPLFPLNAVLFPGGVLPLRIFEPRYLDMVSSCMKTDTGIGVVLIEDGNESGDAAKPHDLGTLSTISYWHKRNDGMLGVTLRGQQRFRILSSTTQSNQLVIADVELLNEYDMAVKDHAEEKLIKLLKQIIALLEPPYTTMDKFYDDLDWVSGRLIELLPIKLQDKQKLLLLQSIDERIDALYPLLVSMEMI